MSKKINWNVVFRFFQDRKDNFATLMDLQDEWVLNKSFAEKYALVEGTRFYSLVDGEDLFPKTVKILPEIIDYCLDCFGRNRDITRAELAQILSPPYFALLFSLDNIDKHSLISFAVLSADAFRGTHREAYGLYRHTNRKTESQLLALYVSRCLKAPETMTRIKFQILYSNFERLKTNSLAYRSLSELKELADCFQITSHFCNLRDLVCRFLNSKANRQVPIGTALLEEINKKVQEFWTVKKVEQEKGEILSKMAEGLSLASDERILELLATNLDHERIDCSTYWQIKFAFSESGKGERKRLLLFPNDVDIDSDAASNYDRAIACFKEQPFRVHEAMEWFGRCSNGDYYKQLLQLNANNQPFQGSITDLLRQRAALALRDMAEDGNPNASFAWAYYLEWLLTGYKCKEHRVKFEAIAKEHFEKAAKSELGIAKSYMEERKLRKLSLVDDFEKNHPSSNQIGIYQSDVRRGDVAAAATLYFIEKIESNSHLELLSKELDFSITKTALAQKSLYRSKPNSEIKALLNSAGTKGNVQALRTLCFINYDEGNFATALDYWKESMANSAGFVRYPTWRWVTSIANAVVLPYELYNLSLLKESVRTGAHQGKLDKFSGYKVFTPE